MTKLIHTKNGNLLLTDEDIISNAKEQEAAGIAPSFAWYDHKEGKAATRPGWLVWSTWEDGCGVVVKAENGSYYTLTGWQSDFVLV